MSKVYLALYKGTGGSLYDRITDWLIRKVTQGQYSHCEIAVAQGEYRYDCYTSSPRDGGVRHKAIELKDGKWDLIALSEVTAEQVKRYYAKTRGCKYDWWGALGVVFGVKQKRSRYFCSEWCGEVLGLRESWRFSPNDLVVIIGGKQMT